MAFDFRALKAEKKPEFHKNFRKYYPAESLESVGFARRVCSNCGRGFWSASERDVCDEPACSGGYRFIGEKLTRKRFKYREAWDEYVKTFSKWGYKPIKRYPVVCRWYEDLYFVNAGVNDFQPYVVSGEVEPPAPAVLEPQFCLRFQDMDSVGVTGRHYTGFIMVGQHTFNTPERHVYFKDEGILQIHEFLTQGLGIKAEEIVYHEDVWAGGGNYGPSMEFFSRGLELGNQVYMQYEVLQDGSNRELKTKVIDMGAGLERWAWYSQGNPMSYDAAFPEVMKYIYKTTGFKFDEKFMATFGRYSGMLDIDEVEDIGSVWGTIAKEMGLEMAELKKRVYEMRALYAMADHTRTLLVAIHDGALPSNVGGGYNLRNILRRCWSLMDEFQLELELERVFEEHVKEFGGWYTELKDTGSLYDIIAVEKERYRETREKGRRLVENEDEMTVERMVELYDSHGITPDLIREITGSEIPDNFYRLVEERHQRQTEKKEEEVDEDFGDVPQTRKLYYEDPYMLKFEANVMAASGPIKAGKGQDIGSILLNQTAFYPESGGQEADYGHLQIGNNRYEVVDVQKRKGGLIAHKIKDSPSYWNDESIIGTKVFGFVDETRRTQLMQHHTATHIVNAAARDVLGPHVYQAGAHKSVRSSRLDITHYKAVDKDEVDEIEKRANAIVDEAHPIGIQWMKRNDAEEKYGMSIYQGGAVPGTELRIVNVEGIDVEACGGTHLKNTEETGHIKMLSAKRIQDGVVRLEFTAGGAAEKQTGREEELFGEALDKLGFKVKHPSYDPGRLAKAAGILKVQPAKLPQTVERFMKEYEADASEIEKTGGESERIKSADDLADAAEKLFGAWKRNRKTLEKLRAEKGGSLAGELEEKFRQQSVVKYVTSGLSVKALTEAANQAVEEEGRLVILLNKAGERVNVVVASSSEHNAGEICKKLSAELGGGGGGKPSLAIGGGKVDGAEEKVEEFEIF